MDSLVSHQMAEELGTESANVANISTTSLFGGCVALYMGLETGL